MEPFNVRFRQLIDSSNCRGDKAFAASIGERVENVSRVASGKVAAPRITFLRKVVEGRNLNPRELYSLLMGVSYVESPVLEKQVADLKNRLEEKNREIRRLVQWIDQLIASQTVARGVSAGRRPPIYRNALILENPGDDPTVAEIIARNQLKPRTHK